jgi:hypothetical protein
MKDGESIFTRYLGELSCRKNDYTLSVVNANTRIVCLDASAPLFKTDSLSSGKQVPSINRVMASFANQIF